MEPKKVSDIIKHLEDGGEVHYKGEGKYCDMNYCGVADFMTGRPNCVAYLDRITLLKKTKKTKKVKLYAYLEECDANYKLVWDTAKLYGRFTSVPSEDKTVEVEA